MIRLLFILVVILIAWQLFRMLNRKPTIEDARTTGLQEASSHINNPILLEDYVAARRIRMEALETLIEQGAIPSYRWYQFIFIENRKLVKAVK